ncbi:MAG: DUF2577 family protein [Clostridia bacterium]|nr:DUF2577 family protein [Clostridia bacterium]
MYSDEILETIKKIAKEAVNADKPLEVVYGVCSNKEPLRIRISENIEIDGDWLEVSGGAGIEPGDKVVLLKAMQGRKFIILSKENESVAEPITDAEIDIICQ